MNELILLSALIDNLMLMAYVGPGVSVTTIGIVILIGVAILVAIFGFLWYPIRRLLGKGKDTEEEDDED